MRNEGRSIQAMIDELDLDLDRRVYHRAEPVEAFGVEVEEELTEEHIEELIRLENEGEGLPF